MKAIRRYCVVLLCFSASFSFAQIDTGFIGRPLDIPLKGWNKVLCMTNGRTMLFHFDIGKPIIVHVFDSTHKQLASLSAPSRLLDFMYFEDAAFIGIYCINNEAVLFIDQDYLYRHQLIRLRFSSESGKLVEEKVVAESKNEGKRMHFFTMKNKDEDNYAILFATDLHHFHSCDLFVVFFNNRHEELRKVQLDVDRKKYEYLEVIGAESQPNGVCITLSLSKLLTTSSLAPISPVKALYDHHVALYYIPKDSATAKSKLVNFSTDIHPDFAHYSYNPFAQSLNLYMYSFSPIFYNFVRELKLGSEMANAFLAYDEQTLDPKLNWVTYDSINTSYRKRGDTTSLFYGMPLKMFTNENGLTTVVTEGFNWYIELETHARSNHEIFLGNIGITQFDDVGNEIWGMLIPKSQYFKSYAYDYWPKPIVRKRENFRIFGDLPPQVYQRQFISLNSYMHNNNLYLVFNDYNKRNIKPEIEKNKDTVYNFDNTNACYYKVDRKKSVTSHYLLGEPARKEYKCSFIEGADFDEKRGVYATLIQYKKADDIQLRMAWRKLD